MKLIFWMYRIPFLFFFPLKENSCAAKFGFMRDFFFSLTGFFAVSGKSFFSLRCQWFYYYIFPTTLTWDFLTIVGSVWSMGFVVGLDL